MTDARWLGVGSPIRTDAITVIQRANLEVVF